MFHRSGDINLCFDCKLQLFMHLLIIIFGVAVVFVSIFTTGYAILYQECLCSGLALGCVCIDIYNKICNLVSRLFGGAVGFGMRLYRYLQQSMQSCIKDVGCCGWLVL